MERPPDRWAEDQDATGSGSTDHHMSGASPRIRDLVETSSLGTDGARQLRDRADHAVAMHLEWARWRELILSSEPDDPIGPTLQGALNFATKCERLARPELAAATYALIGARLVDKAAGNLATMGRAAEASTWRARAHMMMVESVKHAATRAPRTEPGRQNNHPDQRHVVSNEVGGWDVLSKGGGPGVRAESQAEAIEIARRILRNAGGGEVLIHHRDGSIRRAETVASDPHPPE